MYAPFGKGKGKKVWRSLHEYSVEMQRFLAQHPGDDLPAAIRAWYSKPEHGGKAGVFYQKRLFNRLAEIELEQLEAKRKKSLRKPRRKPRPPTRIK